MIRLVPKVTNAVSTPGTESSGAGSGPALISRSTTYRGARRPAPVPRMLLLTALTPEPEAEAPEGYYDAFIPVFL